MKAALRLLALSLLLIPGAVRAADSYPTDQVMGKADAPVTIIEYASLTCPHCAHLEETTMVQLRADWINTGKAKLIYRDFPTAPAGLSLAASMVTHCSGPQRYFGVLDLLFRTQDKWAVAAQPVDEIKHIVAVAGISPQQVDSCLQRQDLMDALKARAEAAATAYGIDSTPSLVIDGTLYAGDMSYDSLKPKLDEAYAADSKK